MALCIHISNLCSISFSKMISTERKSYKFFELLDVGFGPKGIPGRMCYILVISEVILMNIGHG